MEYSWANLFTWLHFEEVLPSIFLAALQKAQNRAARVVTKLEWSTPTADLLSQCGWLSVHQLVVYHSVVLVFKIIRNESPRFLFSMFSAKYSYKTKQARTGQIKHTRDLDLGITKDSFRWRASGAYNELPQEIRDIETLHMFKKATKDWIKKHIPLAPPWTNLAWTWGTSLPPPIILLRWKFRANNSTIFHLKLKLL